MWPVGAARTNPDKLEDAALVDSARRGDGAAFAVIMQRYNRRLYRVARAVLNDDVEAEEIVQETYVRAFSHLSDFRGEAGLSTWLTRITLNEALGHLRRRRPTVGLEAIDAIDGQGEARVVPFPAARGEADPEAATARTQVRRMLERAIGELPELFRVVLVMRDIEEMSTEETAAHLDLRQETVKTRLHRARRLLRKTLEDELVSALTDVFPFEGARCARITQAVLSRFGHSAPQGW